MFKLILSITLATSAAAPFMRANVLGGYVETTLQTNLTDPNLVNPWGVSFSGSSPFWVSDNGTGKASLYNSAGVIQGLVVTMPVGSTDVTGQVFNGTSSFHGDLFLFATENGTVTGWRGALGTNAENLFTVSGADYKGLAISSTQDTLYAANFSSGAIDVFNSSGLIGSFSDPNAPAGYAPFNIENIGGVFYVTFAVQAGNGDDSPGAGHGMVAIFNPATHTFTSLIAANGQLNSPWGVAVAPSTFGAAAGDLLVGNFGEGTINAFNPVTGAYLGTLGNTSGLNLSNDGLWALTFGNGGSGGSTTSLYVTAGPNGETGGLFAQISVAPEPSTFWMAGASLVMLLAFVRMRRRA